MQTNLRKYRLVEHKLQWWCLLFRHLITDWNLLFFCSCPEILAFVCAFVTWRFAFWLQQGGYSTCLTVLACVELCNTSGHAFCLFQTPGLWIDEGAEQGSPHQRSASWGSADHLKEVDSPLVTSALQVAAATDSGWMHAVLLSHLIFTQTVHRPDVFQAYSIYLKSILFVSVWLELQYDAG